MKLQRMKRRIAAELEQVNRAVVILKKEPRPEELEGFGDNTPLSEEIEAILSTEDKELRADRLGRLLDRAAALDEAIHRIDQGSYGICVSCDRRISPERLEAVPEASRCAQCQRESEQVPVPPEHHGGEWKLAEELNKKLEEFDEGGLGQRPRSPGEFKP